ncbi:MAG: PorV/PorQ family protein, partial [Ignavibacteriae bacterium]|nr:PorV/PorQ family protein [Ignavibacteriota bacterium]
MKLKRLFFGVALIGLWAAQVHAQKVGTSSLQFLKVMPTARATAMGEAFSTLATGAEAAFWNPAGIALTQNPEFAGTLTLWLFDSKQGAASFAYPMGDWGNIALHMQYVDFGSIQETSVDQLRFIGDPANGQYNLGLTGRTFTPYSYVIGLSYARELTDKFSAGITAKFVSESLWDGSTFSVVNPATGQAETMNSSARL